MNDPNFSLRTSNQQIQTEFISKPAPVFDPRTGAHYWAIFGMWSCKNPEELYSGSGVVQMDHENLMVIQGPLCYFCEQSYTPSLAKERCKGS